MPYRTIRIKNDLGEIARAGRAVSEMLERERLPASFIRTINLGLEEVTSNIVKYAYGDNQEHEIEITLELTAADVQIMVSDDGREFNPLAQPEPDSRRPLDEREAGGLGVSFLRHLFDKLEYRYEAQRNILLLRKVLPS